jgi:hypothetical protein
MECYEPASSLRPQCCWPSFVSMLGKRRRPWLKNSASRSPAFLKWKSNQYANRYPGRIVELSVVDSSLLLTGRRHCANTIHKAISINNESSDARQPTRCHIPSTSFASPRLCVRLPPLISPCPLCPPWQEIHSNRPPSHKIFRVATNRY